MDEMAWPSAGDDAFVEGITRATNAYPHWFEWWHRESMIAEGFKEAADRIVLSLEESNHDRYADKYLFPVGFLYRHYLELSMKEIVRLGVSLQILEEPEVRKILKSHDLLALWGQTRRTLITFWANSDPTPVNAVESVMRQFHQIDGNGQAFRYSTDKEGETFLADAPRVISLSEMRKVMDGIHSFFDGCQAGLGEAVSNMRDMQDYWTP